MNSDQVLPPPPDLRGLFAEDPASEKEKMNPTVVLSEEEQAALIARAQEGERSVLKTAHEAEDFNLYDRLLDELVQRADSDQALLALMSYVGTNELRVNKTLAQAVLA